MTSLTTWLTPLPLFAVLRGITPAETDSIGDALVGAGFRILEVPLNSPDPFTSIERMARRYPECLIGAGTVLNVADVARVAAAGGKLVVSPHAHTEVIRATKQQGMMAVPGV